MAQNRTQRHAEHLTQVRNLAKHRWFSLACAGLVGVVACAEGPAPLHVYVARAGARRQYEADELLRSAAQSWGRACGVTVMVETRDVHDPDGVPVHVVDRVSCPPSSPRCAGVLYSARSGRPDTIYVADGRPDDETVRIMTHEAGHALGVPHIEGTVMSPTLSDTSVIPTEACDHIHAYYR